MEFIQIIEMRTKKFDEIETLEEEWRQATEGTRTLRRAVVVRDRNDPDRHLVLAFFDSYDEAMTNSNLPATGEFGQKMAAFLDAPPVFHDLDVLSDRS
jgi:quinol monooxygenase YgiN